MNQRTEPDTAMDTETIVSTGAPLSTGLYKYKKSQQKKGSIPTLVESVVFEHTIDEIENEDEHLPEYEVIKPESVPKIETERRNSLSGVLPKVRRGSLGHFLGLKSRADPSPGRDGSYTKNEEGETPKTSQPRRSSISVFSDSKGRRKSWATRLQADGSKKRIYSPEDNQEPDANGVKLNGRRPSWWNNLVPENMLKTRSRRSSQQLTKSEENILQPYRRSKSRSVDHGFAAPFDLDSLRSKVEGRFDAVQKDEEDTSIKRLSIPPPIKTTTYSVRDRDTLTSVAARFDTTPSELTKINRLATNFIFPGQNLLVPDKSGDDSKEGEVASEGGESSETSSQQTMALQEKDFLETLRPVSPEPPTSPAAPQRFLKINVRHITDGQGVVSGVLLVTPNAVMFDPNVSDTLVLEHGPESYGVIAPMEFVVNAAIYYDIAHMRTQDVNPNLTKGEKPEIYYMNKVSSPDKDSLVKDETFPELAATMDNDSSDMLCDKDDEDRLSESNREDNASKQSGEEFSDIPDRERGGDAFPKAFDRDRVTPTNAQQEHEERRRSLLDHHWAVPIKERMSVDLTHEVRKDDGSVCSKEPSEDKSEDYDEEDEPRQLPDLNADLPALHLVKLSYHDSGIDIRDPLPVIMPNFSKKVYSDADIVLSQDWVPPPTIIGGAEPPLSAPPAPSEERVRKHAVSFSLDTSSTQPATTPPATGDKKNKMLKRLSYPLSWMEGLAGDNSNTSSTGGGGSSSGSQGESLPTSADSHNSGSVFSKVFNSSPMNLVELGTGLFLNKTPSEEGPHDSVFPQGRSSYGGFGKSDAQKKAQLPPPRLDYRSMVSVDDMPELFASFDKLIPRPARSCDDPPLYLRLRMGRPMNRAVPKSTPLMSYGRKRMRPEYWFSVPRNRVDDLYKFLNHWVPELYGELGDVTQRGYILVDSDTELWDEESSTPGEKGERSDSQGDMGDLTRESWELLKAPYVKIYSILKSQGLSGDSDEQTRDEVLSMSDELRRALYSSGASVDMEFCPPDLIGVTEILTSEHREKICGHLPARAQGYMWSLVFSTSVNGFSLNSLYRKMQRVDSPVLLVVQDTENNVFGALASCALHPSEHFYGTGESFLFSFSAKRSLSPPNPNKRRTSASPPQHVPTVDTSATAPINISSSSTLTSNTSMDTSINTANNSSLEGATLKDASPTKDGELSPPPVDKVFRVWQWTGDNLYFIRGSNDNISIGAGDGKFGLWLDGDLYQGRTQACTTYGNDPLTTREDFIIKILECWAFI